MNDRVLKLETYVVKKHEPVQYYYQIQKFLFCFCFRGLNGIPLLKTAFMC